MRKRNVLGALAVAAMVLQLVGTPGSAGAQTAPEVTFTFSPTSGDPGSKINFSGTGCPHDATKAFDGYFYLAQGNANTAMKEFASNAQGGFSGEYDTTGVPPGEYTTYVLCTNTTKLGFGTPFTVTAPVIPGSTYFPLSPARVLDTRDGTGIGGTANPIGPGGAIDLKVTGAGAVPDAGVTAVALNVVAASGSGPAACLTVWATGVA